MTASTATLVLPLIIFSPTSCPCFFHDVIGNVRTTPLETIVTRNPAAFGSSLRVSLNSVCARCVRSPETGWRNAPWLS
jgi:hypothetical protein